MDDNIMRSPVSGTQTGRPMRACHTCAVAKARCLPRGDGAGGRCQRCHRLDKQCIVQVRRSIPNQHQRRAQVTELESKLDGIVSLLTAPQSHQHRYPSPASTLIPSYNSVSPGSIPSRVAPEIETTPSTFVTNAEADALLEIFREKLAHRCPFVVLPLDMNTERVREERPFVLQALLSVMTYREPARQHLLSQEFLETVSKQMFVKGEKSLDILQGLLIYLSWYTFNVHTNTQITNILQLAIALVIDLRLNKPPYRQDRHKPAFGDHRQYPSPPLRSRHSLDEQRAFLGCFYYSSVVSVCSKRFESMRFSPYMTECCRVLSETSASPGDMEIVHLVQLQAIAERIGQTLPFEGLDTYTSAAPIDMCIKSFETELQQWRSNLPPGLRQDTSILIHYHGTNIYLREISIYHTLSTHETPTHMASTRFSHLHSLLASLAAMDSLYLTIPTSSYFHYTYDILARFAYGFIVTTKLLSLQTEGWDLEYARSVLCYSAMLEEIARKFREARVLAGVRGDDVDFFSRVVDRLRRMGEMLDVGARALGTSCASAGSIDVPMGIHPQGDSDRLDSDLGGFPDPISDDVLLAGNFLDGFEGEFWDGILGSWG